MNYKSIKSKSALVSIISLVIYGCAFGATSVMMLLISTVFILAAIQMFKETTE